MTGNRLTTPDEAHEPTRRAMSRSVRIAVTVGLVVLGLLTLATPWGLRCWERRCQYACSSNVAQLALGVLMYAQDYDERFPSAATWDEAIFPHVKNREVFRCPRNNTKASVSYAMHERWGLAGLGEIDAPAEAVMLYEVEAGQPTYRHNDGINLGFCDGHRKWLKASPEIQEAIAAGGPEYYLRTDEN